jgi:K+-sensing histidine kinase KdpD
MAAVAVAAALAVSLLLGVRLDPVVFAPFVAAVGIAAVWGGFGPAIAATIVSAVICYRVFLAPLLLLELDHNVLWQLTLHRLGIFVASALAITVVAALRRYEHEELRRAQRQLLGFVADRSIGLGRLSADGRIRWGDATLCSLSGRAPNTLVGAHVSELIPNSAVNAALLDCLAAELPVENRRAHLRKADGSLCDVLVNASAAWSTVDEGKPSLLFAVLPVVPIRETSEIPDALASRPTQAVATPRDARDAASASVTRFGGPRRPASGPRSRTA